MTSRATGLPATAFSTRLKSPGRSRCPVGSAMPSVPRNSRSDFELGEVGLVVDAVEAGRVALLQRLRRRHVGQHHELLDQLVAVEPLAHADLGDAAVVAERDQPLGQVEVERAALLARRQQDAVGAVERLAPRSSISGASSSSGWPSRGALQAVVGEARRRTHHGAVEAVLLQLALGVDPHLGDQHRPVLARQQRAPVVGQRLGQHRHDPVGEIDRGAAAVGGAVERLVGPHVPGDVGDGDQQAPAARMVADRARRTPRRRSRAHPRRRW